MACDGRGGRRDKEPVHRDKKESAEAEGRHGAAAQGPQEAEEAGPLEPEVSTRLRFYVTARRVRIDPEAKRVCYIERLEKFIDKLDRMASNTRVPRKTRLRAVEIMVKTISMCYSIVSDVEVEQLEAELKELEEEDRGEAETGYAIEENTTS